jgi:hypothetical protein
MEMWGETCPILSEVRPWFKDKSLEEQGRKYWKKRSYLFQGFVGESAFKEEGKTPENPIRRFIIGSQIFNIVKAALLDPDMEEIPTDFLRGTDFRITKTSKGGYADYSTSNWARRERALSEEENAAIKQYGTFNLKDFLPKKPGEVELKVMMEMFEASVNGEAYDAERWGQYFKPAGFNSNNSAPKASAPAPASSSVDEEDPPFEPTPTAKPVATEDSKSEAGSRAQDILKMIRSRQQ